MTRFKPSTTVSVLVILAAASLVAMLIWKTDPLHWVQMLINRDTHPALFITLMAFLPAIGFPITVFLILVGIKFGSLYGMLITALTLPLHMIMSYFLARTFFRNMLLNLLNRRGFALPQVSSKKSMAGVFLFLFLPGLSYALKNYLLALTDIRLRTYLGLNVCAQGVIALPVAGLGGAAAEHNPAAIGLFVALIVLLVLGRWAYKKRRGTYPS